MAAQSRGWDGAGAEGSQQAEEMSDLAEALRDLRTIKTEANTAANQILSACEGLLDSLDEGNAEECRAAAEAAAIEIMTACGFEDLVGQRATHASRIVNALMAKRLEALGSKPEADDTSERLSQASVDAFFRDET
ncbi:hypothetical protein [Methyloligella solikamskensis]|uniref:Uncharacterized protein n=1 Tax=Methyloligella solikamskensis TaxID=1177756 RepID=A0ABW3JDJ6_9HYPH